MTPNTQSIFTETTDSIWTQRTVNIFNLDSILTQIQTVFSPKSKCVSPLKFRIKKIIIVKNWRISVTKNSLELKLQCVI